MKSFICDLFLTISLAGGVLGIVLLLSKAIKPQYALMIMFGFMLLWFFTASVENDVETKNKATSEQSPVNDRRS